MTIRDCRYTSSLGVTEYQIDDHHVDEFLKEIVEVCKRRGFSISHEDGHGSFVIRRGFDQHLADWLSEAFIEDFEK